MSEGLRLKLGYDSLTFEADGNPDAVFKARDHWLESNKTLIAQLTQKKGSSKPVKHDENQSDSSSGDREDESGLFRKDDKGNLSLKGIFPEDGRVADAALLLLYGYKQIQEADEIFAVRLKSNLKDSGYTTLGRLDREMAKLKNQGFVNPFGEKRSRKYRITGQGIRRGKELAEEMAKVL